MNSSSDFYKTINLMENIIISEKPIQNVHTYLEHPKLVNSTSKTF